MRAKEVLGVIESDSTELVGSYDSALKINKIGGVCEQTADWRNLFKFESLTAPTNGVLALHESGVAALLEDYMFIGTANSYGGCVVTVANPIKGNGLYSNLFVISGSYTGTIKHKAVDSNGNETTAVAIGTALSLDSTKEYTKFVIAFEEGAVCTDLVLGFKVSKTDYNTFTPYIEHVPSPDYPVEIKKSVVSEIRTHGSQLIPGKITLNNTGLSVKKDEQNRIFLSGTTRDSALGAADIYLYGEWGGDDDLGIRGQISYTTNLGVAYLMHNTTVVSSRGAGETRTVNITDDNYITAIFVRLQSNTTYNGFLEVMMNAGAETLPYEPYTESVITLSQPIELYGIGDVQDVITPQKIKGRFYKFVLDGTQNPHSVHTDTSGGGTEYRYKLPYLSLGNTNVLCNIAKVVSSGTSWNTNQDSIAIPVSNDAVYLRVPSWTDVTDSATLTAKLKALHDAGTPVYVVYELAEEVIEDLPLTDQIALSCLKTFHGVTYVEFDGEVQPTFNSDYATNLEGAITLQAQADNRIGKANTLVNRAEGESNTFEVRVEHGLVYLYKDDVLHGVLGANNVITNGESYRAMNVKAWEDADFIALTNKKTDDVCYYMNINQIPFTSNNYTEAHYFAGDARFTGNIHANDYIFSNNLQVNENVIAHTVQAVEYMKSKYMRIDEKLTTQGLQVTSIGIGEGATQPVEWVWDGALQRWVLCTVTGQQE